MLHSAANTAMSAGIVRTIIFPKDPDPKLKLWFPMVRICHTAYGRWQTRRSASILFWCLIPSARRCRCRDSLDLREEVCGGGKDWRHLVPRGGISTEIN